MQYKCLFVLLLRNQKLSNYLLLSQTKNQIFLGFNVFFLLVTLSLRNNAFRTIFLFQKDSSRKPRVHFLFVERLVCFNFTAYTCFERNSFLYAFLYLSKCVNVSECFPKILFKVEIVLLIVSLQSTTHDNYLCCSVV